MKEWRLLATDQEKADRRIRGDIHHEPLDAKVSGVDLAGNGHSGKTCEWSDQVFRGECADGNRRPRITYFIGAGDDRPGGAAVHTHLHLGLWRNCVLSSG